MAFHRVWIVVLSLVYACVSLIFGLLLTYAVCIGLLAVTIGAMACARKCASHCCSIRLGVVQSSSTD
eukprot:5575194-Alexandrium_andersonii.AAC.1